MERSKVLAYSMTQTEEKYIELQKANSITAKTIHQEITGLEDEEKILRLSRKQNDKLEGQKILSKIKTLEKKVHKIEILSHQNYKEALIFNGGQVCSLSGNNISEIFYVLKNCHNKLFRKQVKDDSSIQMYTIQNENILKSLKILQTQHKVKLFALTELKYLQSGSIVDEETDIKKLFISQDLYYQQEEEEELHKINFDFGFMKLLVDHIDSDYRNLTIHLMLEIEQIFHDFVSKYIESTWAPQEARQAWRDKLINAQELEDLNRIVSKFPSQVFFVNTKFTQTIHDEQEKHTRQRVFWFYSKQSLSLSFKGVLSSLDQPYSMLYCICLTLYVQLLKYVHSQIQKKLKKVEESNEEVNQKKKNKKQRVIEDESDYEDESEQEKEQLEQYKYKSRSSRVK